MLDAVPDVIPRTEVFPPYTCCCCCCCCNRRYMMNNECDYNVCTYVTYSICYTCRRLEMETCVLSEAAGPLTLPLLLFPIQPVEKPKSS